MAGLVSAIHVFLAARPITVTVHLTFVLRIIGRIADDRIDKAV
jgi:hypothetical protein